MSQNVCCLIVAEIFKYTVRAHPFARALPHGNWSLMRPSALCTWARASCGFVL